jgi:hypothetical protein
MDTKTLKMIDRRVAGPTFLKHVSVNSVDEYFALPTNEREHWGLYRKPYALPMDKLLGGNLRGWDAWEKQIKSQYPVQWFFREWFTSYKNPVYSFIMGFYYNYTELKYAIKRFIKPFYPRFRKAFPRHKYSDVSEVLRNVNFALLLDFWYEEMVDGVVNWNSNQTHKKFYRDVKNAVKYIEVERPALEKKSTDELLKTISKKKGTFDERYAKYDALEEKINQKDRELLVWMMQQREMFWT